jgi:enoyl-CoA hydratase
MAVRQAAQGAVRILTIDRPEAANALDPDTSAELHGGLRAAEKDDAVAAVVLTGAGQRAFCAGMDLKAFAARGPGPSPLTELLRGSFGKPLVAAVNGPAVAGGFELALRCDLVVAAEHAWFAIPEVKRGLFAAGGGTFLPRRIPLAVALELGLTGERLSSARGLALGLVNRVVPAERVVAEAVALAELVARNAPLAVQATKELMLASAQAGAADLWAQVDEARERVFGSADAREGATAFAQRREPRWTGR